MRDVELTSYLPPYMTEYKETVAALTAEDPEFALVWRAAERTLNNEFIGSADEYGVSRLEKMLGIFPAAHESLGTRKFRLQNRYLNALPYTLKALIVKLVELCGGQNFTVTKDYLHYRIRVETDLELYGQVDELNLVFDRMVPCNMIVTSVNFMPCESHGWQYIAGGLVFVEVFTIS